VDFRLNFGLFKIRFTLASIEAYLAITQVKATASLTITVMGIKIKGSLTLTWGSPPNLATQVGSTLYLNVGDRASYRGKYYDEVADESYRISQDGGKASRESTGRGLG